MSETFRFPAGTPIDELLGVIRGTHEVIECFTHVDPDDPTKMTRYDVTGLRRFCSANTAEVQRCWIILQESWTTPEAREQRGIEQHRLDRLGEKQLDNPVLLLQQEDGSEPLLVDGSHRYVKAWELGYSKLPGYVLTPAQWKPFVLSVEQGLTAEKLLAQDSGIGEKK